MSEKKEMKFVAGKTYQMVPLGDVVGGEGFKANSKMADWSSLESFAVELPTAHVTVQWMGTPGEDGTPSATEGQYRLEVQAKEYKELGRDDSALIDTALAQLETKVREVVEAGDLKVEKLVTKLGKKTYDTVPFEGDVDALVKHMKAKLEKEFGRSGDGKLVVDAQKLFQEIKAKAEHCDVLGVSEVKEFTEHLAQRSEEQAGELDAAFEKIANANVHTLSAPNVLASEVQAMRMDDGKEKEPKKLLPDGPSKPNEGGWLVRLTRRAGQEQENSVEILM